MSLGDEIIPIEFSDYVWHNNVELEIVPFDLYSTMHYLSGVTTQLTFFNDVTQLTNMYIPGMLPNPQSMLIEHIYIEGISSNLRHGECMLIVANKIYTHTAAWRFSLREKGWKLNPKLCIAPLVNFQFRIRWETPVYIRGLDDMYRPSKKIQVHLHGRLARPVC